MNLEKRIFVILAVVMLLFNCASLTFGETKMPQWVLVTSKSGYLTATKYIEMPKRDRIIYVTGFFDGLSAGPMIVKTESYYQDWFDKMFDKKINNHQLEAVITEYLKKHPEMWHEPLNGLIYKALFEAFANKFQEQ